MLKMQWKALLFSDHFPDQITIINSSNLQSNCGHSAIGLDVATGVEPPTWGIKCELLQSLLLTKPRLVNVLWVLSTGWDHRRAIMLGSQKFIKIEWECRWICLQRRIISVISVTVCPQNILHRSWLFLSGKALEMPRLVSIHIRGFYDSFTFILLNLCNTYFDRPKSEKSWTKFPSHKIIAIQGFSFPPHSEY